MKVYIIAGVITIILLVIEYLLCTKLKSPLWGGIIPLLTLGFSIYVLATGRIAFEITSFIVFLALNIFMFEEWDSGRDKYKKREQVELDKMKAHDIDA